MLFTVLKGTRQPSSDGDQPCSSPAFVICSADCIKSTITATRLPRSTRRSTGSCFVRRLKRIGTRVGSLVLVRRAKMSSCYSRFLSCSRCAICRMARPSFRFSTDNPLDAFLVCTSARRFPASPSPGVFGKTSSRSVSYKNCLRPSMRTFGTTVPWR